MPSSRSARYIVIGVADELLTTPLTDFPSGTKSVTLGMLAGVSKSLRSTRRTSIGLAKAITGVGLPAISRSALTQPSIKVVHSMHENGPKLVEMTQSSALALRAAKPGVRIVREKFYKLARFDLVEQRLSRATRGGALAAKSPSAATSKVLTIRVVGKDSEPVEGARVAAFWDLKNNLGDDGITDKTGWVRLRVIGTVRRIYVRPRAHYWSKTLSNPRTSAKGELGVELTPIHVGDRDALSHFYRLGKTWSSDAGAKVRVAIIDGGVGPHPDLNVATGANLTEREPADRFGDNGLGHGTHVAGIIGGRGDGKSGFKGFAPAAALLSYRVCEKDDANVSSYALGRAIEAAVKAKCHLINLSLALDEEDEFAALWIKEAWNNGCLVVAAVGNGGRQPVGWPAAIPAVIGVSAFGRRGTFPKGAEEVEMIEKPLGEDKNDFFASFSNKGQGVDFTAPGVGILSTFPGGGYAIQSGTSMACPIVTGIAAQLLSAEPKLLRMKPDAARSEAMAQVLFSRAKQMGFGTEFEGFGRCARV
jgi:subtilisin